MNRRTFETLSKYIAGTHKTRIVFDYPGEGACAMPKTGEIHMTSNIASHNALAALALLMHEAAHIAHSTKIPLKFYKDPIKKDIVNAIEDARIDVKNFGLLQNIKGFYERMYRDHKRPDPTKVPLSIKLLLNQIFEYENCARYCYKDKETRSWDQKKHEKLRGYFHQGVSSIEYEDWSQLDKSVVDIIKILKIDKPLDEMMMGSDLNLEGAMSGEGQGKEVDGESKGGGKVTIKGKLVDKDGKEIDMVGTGTDNTVYEGINVIDAILHPKSILQGGNMDGDSCSIIGPAALAEQTKQKFKELLNMKTRKHVEDGSILDVDNLLGYHTGDIDILFKEEVVNHEKRSKIMILMDSSGSMGVPLIDGKYRNRTLITCVKAVTDILDEVIELEGINVDYDLAAFDNEFYKLSKDNWQREYLSRSGGTNFHHAFRKAITTLAEDNSIDGRKMIVCFTDGDVCDEQLKDVKRDIIAYGCDVRAMIIGIGTDPCSKMSTDIVGDNIILAEENADLVLLETIGEML